MGYLFYTFIFLFGLCVGSFLNVLICRLGGRCQVPFQKVPDTISGRSHCPKCGHQLGWQDLVPVLSFILLRGKCRYCGKPISIQYPVVELATGILFIFLFINLSLSDSGSGRILSLSDSLNLIYLLFVVSCLIVIFVSDLKYFIIPDEIIIVGIIGTLLYKLFGNWQIIGYHLLTAIAAGAFFLAIVLATKGRGMGLGDVKLAFLMGLILGWPNILIALLLAFIFGALVGLGLILAGRAKLKSEMPFGTFLTASTFLVMIFGEIIAQRYFEMVTKLIC